MRIYRKEKRTSPLVLRWTRWEYLPSYVANVPVVLTWLWFALRARHPFFFSAANPAIETGGVLGESKINILRRIPAAFLPATLFFQRGTPAAEVLRQVTAAGIPYPLIAKPNVGERGFCVEKLDTPARMLTYAAAIDADFLVQEFVGAPVEMSILCHRMPGSERVRVTSVCLKQFLSVVGDGQACVSQLMQRSQRASLQVDRLAQAAPALLETVPAAGEHLLLEPIGNHCRGTKFLDADHLISPELEVVFAALLCRMEGIFYGRFDLKCQSVGHLLRGDFKVLEFNGVAGEPAHIYDPALPVWKKYRDIYHHWRIIFDIAQVQLACGVRPMSIGQAWRSLISYLAYMRQTQPSKPKVLTS
jgi:hypothetical protein